VPAMWLVKPNCSAFVMLLPPMISASKLLCR
jgi:hypothetical protein